MNISNNNTDHCITSTASMDVMVSSRESNYLNNSQAPCLQEFMTPISQYNNNNNNDDGEDDGYDEISSIKSQTRLQMAASAGNAGGMISEGGGGGGEATSASRSPGGGCTEDGYYPHSQRQLQQQQQGGIRDQNCISPEVAQQQGVVVTHQIGHSMSGALLPVSPSKTGILVTSPMSGVGELIHGDSNMNFGCNRMVKVVEYPWMKEKKPCGKSKQHGLTNGSVTQSAALTGMGKF